MIANLLFFTISALALIASSIFLVKTLDKISIFLRISEFTAAFIIMAVATSIPELFVGISSAISGNPALSLGNVLGASIIDLTLIIGILVLISRNIEIKKERIGTDVYFVLGACALVLLLFIIGKSLSRIDGAILLVFFIFNSIRMLWKGKRYKAKYKQKNSKNRGLIIGSVFVFILSLVVLFIASRFAVEYASLIAIDLNLPQIVIGLFLLSFATTLPELIFGIRACRTGHKSMAIGDQTGTVLANITLILGIVALIKPIEASFLPFIISGIFLFISAFIFTTLVKSENKLTLWEGISLILIYVLFTILELFAKI
jgi:cation:H+ antiporter